MAAVFLISIALQLFARVTAARSDAVGLLEPVAAYDLGTDPLELGDDVDPAWAVELIERHGAELEAAVRRHLSSKALELSEAEQADLAAMGYTGD